MVRSARMIFKKLRTLLARCLSRKAKMFIYLLLIILGTYLVNLLIFYQIRFVHQKAEKKATVKQDYVVVHMDLKGAPPTLEYLTSLLSKLKGLGVNGLLMEYEDMFPYKGTIVNISSPHHYRSAPLKKFLKAATSMGMDVIPLVQTFGHMEHVLKLEEHEYLRERFMYPDVICPSKNESMSLIREMLRQVITFHQSVAVVERIHIGCDEVYELNFCHRCKAKKMDDMDLFIHHIQEVRDIVTSISPQTTVLIWDDMLRKVKPAKWIHYGEITNIEPVCWDYTSKVSIKHSTLRFYREAFDNIWIASAFKGADGRETVLPKLKTRLSNILSWMHFVQGYRFGGELETYDFKGIILTGWSRYSHFEPLCELLPVSIPSLVLQLLVVKRFNEGVPYTSLHEDGSVFFWKHLLEDFYLELGCNDDLRVHIDDFNGCSYNGTFPLLDFIHDYSNFLTRMINKFENNDFELYVEYGNVNMRTMIEFLSQSEDVYASLRYLEVTAEAIMRKLYSKHVYKEYIGYKSYRLYKMLHQCAMKAKSVVALRHWKRGRKIPDFPFFSPPYVTALYKSKNTDKLTTNSMNTVNLSGIIM